MRSKVIRVNRDLHRPAASRLSLEKAHAMENLDPNKPSRTPSARREAIERKRLDAEVTCVTRYLDIHAEVRGMLSKSLEDPFCVLAAAKLRSEALFQNFAF